MKQSMKDFIEVLENENYFAVSLGLLKEFDKDEDPNIEYYLQAAALGLNSIDAVVYCHSKYGHPEQTDKHKQNMYDDYSIDCSPSSALENIIKNYSWDINDYWGVDITVEFHGKVIKDSQNVNLIYFDYFKGNYPNRVPFIVEFEDAFPEHLKDKIIELMSDNDPIVLSPKSMIFEVTIKAI